MVHSCYCDSLSTAAANRRIADAFQQQQQQQVYICHENVLDQAAAWLELRQYSDELFGGSSSKILGLPLYVR